LCGKYNSNSNNYPVSFPNFVVLFVTRRKENLEND